jgi:hypothetical protein
MVSGDDFRISAFFDVSLPFFHKLTPVIAEFIGASIVPGDALAMNYFSELARPIYC